MSHPIHPVASYQIAGPYTLRARFDDGTTQTIDFAPVLEGELFAPLRDPSLFNRVQLDREAHTLVCPNGTDFVPATFHDWPNHSQVFAARAREWLRMAV